MTLSQAALDRLFPADEVFFRRPFSVVIEKREVHLKDAEGAFVATFCAHTQLPLGDDRGLAAEVAYWERQARLLADALNASYPET